MLEINFDLSSFESVELVPLSDVHLGHPLCDEAEFKRLIDYILEEPDDPKCARICLLNGDLTESATKTNRNGNVFEQIYTPSVQVAMMINYLRPLTETSKKYPQGKILSYCAGNHDSDRYKETGISAAESIAVGLGLEKRYSVNGCYSFIKLKSPKEGISIHTVYNTHMTGGSTTVGGKANRIAKISNGVIADLIIGSHVHLPLTFKEDIILPFTGIALVQQTITYLITGAFLKYGDYAEKMSLKPATISTPRVFLKSYREVNGLRRVRKYTEVIL